jgi:hypothetical protein
MWDAKTGEIVFRTTPNIMVIETVDADPMFPTSTYNTVVLYDAVTDLDYPISQTSHNHGPKIDSRAAIAYTRKHLTKVGRKL